MRTPTFLLFVAVILLAGCSGTGSQTSSPSSRLDVLQWGIAGVTDVPTLDPALVSDPTSISVASLVYGGLVRLDRRLQVRPDGADRWTVSPDGEVYTFFIRKNLRYADGRQVTAADFVSTIERALGPDGSAGAASFYLGAIAHHGALGTTSAGVGLGVIALGSRVVRIILSHPSAHFLTQLAFPTSYVPEPNVLALYGPNWTDHAAGFGPYSVETWSHTRYLTLVRNRYYWEGMPAIRRITIWFYPQDGASVAYAHGTVDLVSGLPAGETLPGGPQTQRVPRAAPTGMVRTPGLALDYLAFNTGRLPFHRLNARRAFAAASTPDAIAGAIGTAAFPSTGWLPSAFGIYVSRWRPNRLPSAYLTAARYPRARGFPPIALATPVDTGLTALAHALARSWHQQLGVSVTVRALDLSSYNKVLSEHAFNIALVRWGADYADPQDFLGTQLGSSPDNITGWSTRAYNRDLALADSYALTDDRRTILFRRAADLAARKLPLVPLDEPAVTALIRPDLFGIGISPLGTITLDSTKAGYRAGK